MNEADVVIVGAGAAGLAAGRSLAQSGMRVRIIDARDRVGGRIFTTHAPQDGAVKSLPIELGAEFIHGLPAATWALLEEANLATYELDGQAYGFHEHRLQLRGEEQRDAFGLLRRMAGWLAARAPGTDVSFEEYVHAAGIEASTADRAADYVEGFNAADRRNISATALVRQQQAEDRLQGDRIFHVRAGYDALPQYLADRARRAGAIVSLNSQVRLIRWKRGSVRVHGVTGVGEEFVVHAPRAIVTLPLGVLQANTVSFEPMPLEIERHWRSLAMGQVNRVSLIFDRDFWNERAPNLSFLFAAGEIFPTWWTSAPEPFPIITGWAAGAKNFQHSQALLDAGPLASQAGALQSLASIFSIKRRDLDAWLRGVHHHDWHRDVFSRGAYSYVPTGAVEAPRLLSHPVLATLYFAGEHTDLDDQWGTVHGALSSGLRAAGQALNAA